MKNNKPFCPYPSNSKQPKSVGGNCNCFVLNNFHIRPIPNSQNQFTTTETVFYVLVVKENNKLFCPHPSNSKQPISTVTVLCLGCEREQQPGNKRNFPFSPFFRLQAASPSAGDDDNVCRLNDK